MEPFTKSPRSERSPAKQSINGAIAIATVLLPLSLLVSGVGPVLGAEERRKETRAERSRVDLSNDILVEALRGSALSVSIAMAEGRDRDLHSDAESAARLFRYVERELELGAIEGGREADHGFGQISIHTNAWIERRDGKHPAVAVLFFRSPSGARPLVTRAVFPIVGRSFAIRDRESGRAHGSRPRIGLGDVVVDVLDDGAWRRVGSPLDEPSRRRAASPAGSCDASCGGLGPFLGPGSVSRAWPERQIGEPRKRTAGATPLGSRTSGACGNYRCPRAPPRV